MDLLKASCFQVCSPLNAKVFYLWLVMDFKEREELAYPASPPISFFVALIERKPAHTYTHDMHTK